MTQSHFFRRLEEVDVDELSGWLKSSAENDLVPWNKSREAARRFNLTHHEIEKKILELNLLPKRYQRNRNTIQIEQQKILFNSKVAVVGCGGLGGYVIEELSRLGVGHIVAIDPDVFEEHNLNRQVFSSINVLGKSKVDVIEERVFEINPAVKITPIHTPFSKENGRELLNGADVVVDALDSIKVRFELSEICQQLEIPLVHGSVAGWFGQLAIQFPGEEILQKIYGDKSKKGVEAKSGNVSFGSPVIASLEAAETVKILLNYKSGLKGKILLVDLLEMTFTELSLASS
jgi:molybdopterin/thiamine biosynthesis adenylyltransferase